MKRVDFVNISLGEGLKDPSETSLLSNRLLRPALHPLDIVGFSHSIVANDPNAFCATQGNQVGELGSHQLMYETFFEPRYGWCQGLFLSQS